MLGRLDGEDKDENFLGYIVLKDRSISHENGDEMSFEK